MARTLNQLIEAAVLGGEDLEHTSAPSPEPEREAPAPSASSVNDVEKLASALEFLGRKGVASLLKLGMHDSGSLGTNMHQTYSSHTQKQVAPHAGAPPVSPGKLSGSVENNAGSKPGSSSSVDTGSSEGGTHHSALSGNQSAIDFDKKTKAQRVAPALRKVLDTTPFADGKLKENLSGASGKGDKNVHSKSAHDVEAVRREIARRAATRGA